MIILFLFSLQFLFIPACKDIDSNFPRLIDLLTAWMVGDSAFPLLQFPLFHLLDVFAPEIPWPSPPIVSIDRSNHPSSFSSILSFLDFECDVSKFLERCIAASSSFSRVSACLHTPISPFNRRLLHSTRVSHRGRSCRLHSVIILRLHFILIDAT